MVVTLRHTRRRPPVKRYLGLIGMLVLCALALSSCSCMDYNLGCPRIFPVAARAAGAGR